MTETENQPVKLVEDEDTGDRFLVYGTEKGMRLDIQFQGDQLWMTQAQIAQLFGREVSSISRHINNIFEEQELDEQTSLQKVQRSIGRPVVIYSLDVIISVGYRVSSKQATVFRRWATQTLVQFATKGFVIDQVRLKQPDNADRIRELRDIIRDIRSEEANVYAELRKICTMCQDYVSGSPEWTTFYQQSQAKFVYAVTSHTPSEIVNDRADYNAG